MSDINVTVQDEIVNIDVLDTPILVNVVNSPGQQGPAGPGVPVGGTAGQVLAKNSSTNYDTVWVNQSGGVPYSGATGNVNIGEYEIKAGQVTLDTSPTGTAAVGTIRWNDTTGTSETTLKGGNVIIKNGVDLVARVVNKVSPNTTLTKAAYQAVRVSGAQGQRLAVAFAQANNDANSADTIGIVIETIPTNQEGFIMTVGQLEGINTTGSLQGETWADGDVLYLSPTTAGAITNVQPTGSGHIVVIGYVEYAHANNGKIYVKVLNGWELTELHDTEIISPANNEALIYESSTSLWKNKTIATALGYTPVPTTRNITINGVTYDLSADRTYTISTGISGSGAAGQVTYWTGASAVSGSNNLFWDNNQARLGIATNTPSVRLHIVGTNEIIRLDGGGGGNNAYINFNERGFIGYNSLSGTDIVASTTRPIRLGLGAWGTMTPYLTIYANTGNVGVGFGATDPAVRFGVLGDTLLRGSGNTSATYSLTVQNSASTNILRVQNDGTVNIIAPTNTEDNNIILNINRPNGGKIVSIRDRANIEIGNNNWIYPTTGDANATISRSANGLFLGQIEGTTTTADVFNISLGRPSNINNQPTAGTSGGLAQVIGQFNPTSGSATFTSLRLAPIINQTGGANGITRGLYVNPTLTAAADFRAIETTAGNVLFGASGTGFFWDNANGRLGIGTNAPTSALHVTSTTWNSTQPFISFINLDPQGAESKGLFVQAGALSASSYIANFANYSGTSFFYLDGTGNLGINSTSPSYRLDVNGVARFQNVVRFANNLWMVSDEGSNRLQFVTSSSSIYGSPVGHIWRTASDVTIMSLFSNGNLALGQTSDSGQRLQVIGDTLLRGSGATSATTALTVQNSSSTNLFTVRNDVRVGIGTNAPTAALDIWNATDNAQLRISDSRVSIPNYSGVGFSPVMGTNTLGFLAPWSSSTGGVQFSGFTSNTNTGTPFAFVGIHGGTSPTTPALRLRGWKHNGTTGLAVLTGTEIIAGFNTGNNADVFQVKANGTINMSSLPTSSTGLVAGDLWNDGGTVKIV